MKDERRAAAILDDYRRRGRTSLSEGEALGLLERVGVPVVENREAGTVEEATRAACELGYPVVLKVLSEDVQHKSDVGGVKTDLSTAGAVERAWGEIMSSVACQCPQAVVRGASVQPQVVGGIELILGGLRDPQFGPVVMFGLGGVYTEVLADVAFRLAPLDKLGQKDLIESTRAHALLVGTRGFKAVDTGFLGGLIETIGRLLVDFECVCEVELNPFVALPGARGVAVDALVTLE